MRAKVCIYTAIFGGYDSLKPQPKQSINCDFICFTDNLTDNKNDPWRMVINPFKEYTYLHPRLQAKFFKIMAHKVFAERTRNPLFRLRQNLRRILAYDYCIWIDGSVQILRSDFAEYFISKIGDFGLAMLPHPDRDCIYDELRASLLMRKYKGLPLIEQVDYYKEQGYPAHNGLIVAGLFARDLRVKRLRLINSEWWNENLKWTYQDQLSLPYVLWKNDYSFDKIPLNLWKNKYFEVKRHLKNT